MRASSPDTFLEPALLLRLCRWCGQVVWAGGVGSVTTQTQPTWMPSQTAPAPWRTRSWDHVSRQTRQHHHAPSSSLQQLLVRSGSALQQVLQLGASSVGLIVHGIVRALQLRGVVTHILTTHA